VSRDQQATTGGRAYVAVAQRKPSWAASGKACRLSDTMAWTSAIPIIVRFIGFNLQEVNIQKSSKNCGGARTAPQRFRTLHSSTEGRLRAAQ
jgi:hypothetical protein